MPNKNVLKGLSFTMIAVAVALTALLPEARFFHAWYQLAALAVIMFSMYMPVKDVFIIAMLSSCVVWGMGFFDILRQMHQLVVETAVILLSCAALAWHETNYKREKSERDTIISYKKGEIAGLEARISTLNGENHRLTEELKGMRKYFTH